MPVLPFADYVASLGQLTSKVDPTAATPASDDIRDAVATLQMLDVIDCQSVAAWTLVHPDQAYVLALVVGLSREELTNHVRHWFGTGS